MPRPFRRSRPGFTITEIITAVAVLAIIAAIVVSSDNPETSNDRARYDAASDALNNLARAVAGFEPYASPRSFHQVVKVYPGKLSDLTTPITTSGTNICGGAYTGTAAGTNVDNWAKAANPFYGSQLLPAGTPIVPGFTVQDVLVRLSTVPSSAVGVNSANTTVIRMPSVTLADAQGLDMAMDGVLDGNTGTIRYGSSDPTPVDYYITISVTGSAC